MPILALPLAWMLALAATPLAIRFAWWVGYLDHPHAHKQHAGATPLLGGVAIFLSALIAWLAIVLASRAGLSNQATGLLAGAFVVLCLGLWDDRHGMNPLVKLAGQAIAAAILLGSSAVPELGLGAPGNAAAAMVVLVALMNALNFLDNMNGMVAGLGAITLATFAWMSFTRGAPGLAAAQLALAGGCLGFLRYNFPKARIFLGDAGSLLLGYSLGASAVLTYENGPQGWGRLAPAFMLAYPAFDMIFVVATRLRDGRKVYQGGRDHTNHRLASVLQCPKRTVLLLWLTGAVLCASGLVVQRLNRPTPALLLSGLWILMLSGAGIRLSSVPIEAPRHP